MCYFAGQLAAVQFLIKKGSLDQSLYISVGKLPFAVIGKASHASVAPWLGINALDAVVQCYNNISMMRQQILPECRVHGIITKGGEKPNIIPQIGQLEYMVRGTTDKQRDGVKEKVIVCAKAAAVATGILLLCFYCGLT